MAAPAWDDIAATPGVQTQAASGAPAWDAIPASLAPQAAPEDPGFLHSVAIGAGRTLDRAGKGLQQLYYGVTGNNEEQAKLEARAAQDDSAYAALQHQRPWATGIGESLPSAVMPLGGGATLGANIVRQAIGGAVPGLLSYGSAPERLQSAGWGAVGGAVVPSAVAIGKTLKAAVQPLYSSGQDAILGRLLNRVAGDGAPQAQSAMSAAAPVVPGSFPTAGQVSGNGGIAALERSSSAANPTPYAQRQLEQAAARKEALQSIAGTPQQMADALLARDKAVEPLYYPAKNANYVVDDALSNLTNRPTVKKALTQAQTLAEDKGRPFAFNVTPSNPYSGLGIQGNPNTYVNGHGLQDLKMAMDGMLTDPTGGFAGAQGNTLRDLRGNLIGWMENANPAFKTARQTYSDLSKPINQMQIGKELSEKLSPALSDFGANGSETASKYANALREAEQTARSATGFPAATLENTLTPGQMDILNGVGTDLARKVNSQNLGRGTGSNTAQNIAMQNIAAQSGMPSAMGLVTKIGGKPLDWIYHQYESDMQRKLAEALLNPQQGAQLMQNVQPTFMQNHQALKNGLAQALMRSSFGAGPTANAVQQYLSPTSP